MDGNFRSLLPRSVRCLHAMNDKRNVRARGCPVNRRGETDLVGIARSLANHVDEITVAHHEPIPPQCYPNANAESNQSPWSLLPLAPQLQACLSLLQARLDPVYILQCLSVDAALNLAKVLRRVAFGEVDGRELVAHALHLP